VIFGVLLANTAAASSSGWSQQLAAKPPSKNSALTAVSCASRKACVAVGYSKNKSGRSFALVERWNGVRWSIQPNPAGVDPSVLNSVSCTSATACTAVGSAPPVSYRTGAGAPLVERWDGKTWSIEPIRRFPQGELSSVSCTSQMFCAAVGSWEGIPDYPASYPLLGRWNGRAWSFRGSGAANPVVAGGVSCVSPTACEAIGSWTSSCCYTPLWNWNGRQWSEFDLYDGGSTPYLRALSCASELTCISVGYEDSGALTIGGTTLSALSSANPNPPSPYDLSDVSCVSSSVCVAVGLDQTTYIIGAPSYTLVESWDGSSWTTQLTGTRGVLSGVSCVSANACTAVGSTTTNAGKHVPLVESTIHTLARAPTAKGRW